VTRKKIGKKTGNIERAGVRRSVSYLQSEVDNPVFSTFSVEVTVTDPDCGLGFCGGFGLILSAAVVE
jgi:hypothetical protein